MSPNNLQDIFRQDIVEKLFPSQERSDQFFEALYGDAKEGAYNISLAFKGKSQHQLDFEFQLTPRPSKCLACNLTFGLPNVFARHPAIGIDALVQQINRLLGGQAVCSRWQLGATQERSRELHVIPLALFFDD